MDKALQLAAEFGTKYYNIISTAIYGVFISLGIDVDMVFWLIVMMAVDTVLGSVKAIRQKKSFSFKKFVWGFLTKLIWILIPMVVALFGKALKVGDFTIAIHLVMRVLAAFEFLSIITNLYCIKNKKEIKNVDYISALLKSLMVGTENFIKRALRKIEDSGGCSLDDNKENIDE